MLENTMVWGPDMAAGFALAALLSDDRDLAQVEVALPPELLPELRAELALAHSRELAVRALLRVLRPELDARAVLSLPSRMRALIARRLPRSQRQAVHEGTLASRAGFDADEDLLQATLRIARGVARLESP
jgi:hypothetical protein